MYSGGADVKAVMWRGTVLFIVVCVDRGTAVWYLYQLGTKPCDTKTQKTQKQKQTCFKCKAQVGSSVARVTFLPASSLVSRA